MRQVMLIYSVWSMLSVGLTVVGGTLFYAVPLWKGRMRGTGGKRKGYTAKGLRQGAIFMLVVVGGAVALVSQAGYQWWLGAAGCGALGSTAQWAIAPHLSPTLRIAQKWYLVAHVPLGVALVLAWADCFGFILFPVSVFTLMCAVSAVLFLVAWESARSAQ